MLSRFRIFCRVNDKKIDSLKARSFDSGILYFISLNIFSNIISFITSDLVMVKIRMNIVRVEFSHPSSHELFQ